MKTLKRTREDELKDSQDTKTPTLKKRQTKLTEYTDFQITYYQRTDCTEGLPEAWMPQLLKTIPNFHSKRPDVKARTPNVTIDNLCLFKNDKGEVCTILGFFDKEFQGKRLKGFVLSGGHVEYHEDVDLKQCALRELEEEFHIPSSDLIKSKPVALFDDPFRDIRNRYVSMVFVHWINGAPKPSEEHKVLKIIPLDTLQDLIRMDAGLTVDENSTERFGFLHGHDSMLNVLLKNPIIVNLRHLIEVSQ
jgi:8-oxo-dGTP pyrophosphatase MutT (NUDIX family)